jgi:hypothetical protein
MTMAASNSNPIVERAIRAARLEDAVYDEVARDPDATTQSLLVVIAAAILSGIGSLDSGVGSLISGLMFAPLAWVIGSFLAHFVGTRVFNVQGVTWIEVARALGFAQGPGVFHVLGIIPVLGVLISIAVSIWTLVTGVVALRAALRVTTQQAVITLLLSWVLAAIIVGAVLGALLGVGMGVASLG